MEEQIEIPCCDGENGEIGSPYIFLPLYNADIGNKYDRVNKIEYLTRKPVCVRNFTENGLTLTIANSGLVPSDLIMIEYQIVYCTADFHKPTDGFSTSGTNIHAGEYNSDPFDSYHTVDFIPAKGSINKDIKFQGWNGGTFYPLYNIYFRAKASTVWHEPIPMEKWDFVNDVTVVEAHLRVEP